MAYDRYVAISKPLLYKVVMSPGVCRRLVAVSYLPGLLNATTHISAVVRLSWGSPVINNFYCDGPPLFVVSSTDTRLNEGLVLVGFSMMAPSPLILTSYARGAVAFIELTGEQAHCVFYTIMVPMLNPIIYSLRNKEVKRALSRVIRRKMHF
ncbi:PREDICTED: olfactory receptor 8D1-like [Pterocles gutturalis]|uniref:olfactory receptor 8D1-like n=1 Tax=Pterocles gutturalis TaxID=240206 RepID=UPI000529400D|nr:PREDICTED: olfactory receptor 8D1-like [Pterocles gutturalis]